MKRLVYRFALWLEYRALDLQDWAGPELPPMDLNEVVIGGINRASNEFWKNAVANNALLQRLSQDKE